MPGLLENYLLGTPLTRLALVLVVLLGFLLGGPIADHLGWNKWATRLTLWGLGGSLIPTFVFRIGLFDITWDVRAVNDCLSTIAPSRTDPDSLANLLLLVPFAIGLTWASRSGWVGAGGVMLLGLAIEVGQQVTGLGACERGDLVRNIGGGLVAVGITSAIRWARSRPRSATATAPRQP